MAIHKFSHRVFEGDQGWRQVLSDPIVSTSFKMPIPDYYKMTASTGDPKSNSKFKVQCNLIQLKCQERNEKNCG